MMAFSHLPVAPTKLTIPAEVGFSKKLLMCTKVQRETAVRETPVIFLGEKKLFKILDLFLTNQPKLEGNENVNNCKSLKAQMGSRV